MASETSSSNPLLQPVPQDTASAYYTALLAKIKANGIEVRAEAGGGRGKGVFATKCFQQGDVLWAERPLAAVQQLDSKLEVSTCSHCFKAVGTVEQHVGGKICCLINELADATEEDDLRQVQDRVDKIQAAVNSQFLEGLLQGRVALPLTDKVDMAEPVKCRGGCGEEYCSPSCEAEAWTRCHCLLCPVGAAAEHSSSSSSSSDDKGKGKASTARQHSASCSHSHASSSSSSGPGASSSSSSSSSSSKGARKPAVQQVHGVAVNRAKLGAFFEHADETNDIFRVAAQVIASTIVTGDTLLQQAAADAADGAEAGAAYAQALSAASAGERIAARVVTSADAAAAAAGEGAGSSAAADRDEQCEAAAAFARAATSAQQGSGKQQVLVAAASDAQQQQQCLQALQAAFLPFAVGHKAPWWDVVAEQQEEAEQHTDGVSGAVSNCESDSDSDDVDAAELRAQLKELAADSLELLRGGLQDSRFPQLFDLQLYGSLVGMFELNNLALAVPAPVARYKDMLLHPAECGVDVDAAAAAMQEVQPLLEALGDDADAPAEGTGFYALQSCVNHSCAPNAAATCLPNGQMVVRALSDIPAGCEVLLSYIEEEGTTLQERRAMLRDYGFVCGCERCCAEELAGVVQKQQLVAA